MKRQSSVKLALLFSLIFVLLFAAVSPGAASSSDAVVTISAAQTTFPADQPVVVQVTISNPTNHTLRVLAWFTPVDGVEEPLFAVQRDGQPVGYTGPMIKRPAPTKDDYVSLKAGESLTNDVILSDSYDFSVSGRYTVVYDVSSYYLSPKLVGLPKQQETMLSNALELKVAGRQGKRPGGGGGGGSGNTTFQSCDTTQQNTLLSARSQASTYSNDSLGYLNANNQGPRYTTWFGAYDSGRYTIARDHFNSIASAMSTASVTFDCSCKKRYYAYVYPSQPYTIYLCSVFWSAPLTGTDSKAGTLIHEMSHFTVVAGTDDFVYGQAGAKDLAITDPDKAVNNADNHEYFAENTPAQP